MKPFKQIFEEKRAAESWTSEETAVYFSQQTGRSISTVYRWLDKCPKLIEKLLNEVKQ